MSQKVRMDMLPRLRQRYAGRGRQGKSLMIDELCEQFGYSRKHAIKLLNARSGWGGEPGGRRGRPPKYETATVEVLHWTRSYLPHNTSLHCDCGAVCSPRHTLHQPCRQKKRARCWGRVPSHVVMACTLDLQVSVAYKRQAGLSSGLGAGRNQQQCQPHKGERAPLSSSCGPPRRLWWRRRRRMSGRTRRTG